MRLTRSQQTTEIDAKIAAHAVHAFKDALPSRTTIVEDLLPTERVQLQEHTDIKIVDYETIPFSQLTRTFKQQKTGEDTTFKIGDTVEIKSAAKLPLIAIIVSLHKVAPRSQDVEENEVALSQWKATVHRFELAGSTKVNRKARPHEEVCLLCSFLVLSSTNSERSLLSCQRRTPHRRLLHSQPLHYYTQGFQNQKFV